MLIIVLREWLWLRRPSLAKLVECLCYCLGNVIHLVFAIFAEIEAFAAMGSLVQKRVLIHHYEQIGDVADVDVGPDVFSLSYDASLTRGPQASSSRGSKQWKAE